MSDIICGKWMPRAGAYCARGLGHPPGLCASPEAMESQRQRGRARERVYDPADVVRWRVAHRLKRYGLTQESFHKLLADQGYACAMCREPFTEGKPVQIDHDHNLGCHPSEKGACDRCRRGLLCPRCNTALGYIEKYSEMARAYLGQAQRRSRSGQSRSYPSEYPRAEHSSSPSTSKTYR